MSLCQDGTRWNIFRFHVNFIHLRGVVFVHVGSAKLCMEMVFRLTCAVLWEVALLAQNIRHSGTRVRLHLQWPFRSL